MARKSNDRPLTFTANIVQRTLTDGSIVYSVRLRQIDGPRIEIDMLSRDHAYNFADTFKAACDDHTNEGTQVQDFTGR
jgi:hypothetical protein